jgi:methionyl-tRNA formyltransferase
MKKLPVTLVPNPVLRNKAKKVTTFGPELYNLAQEMIVTMRNHRGMGLAAPQVSQDLRLIVAEYVPEEKGETPIPLTILVNPTITESGKATDVMEEGCLSIPGVDLPIRRSTQVNVLAQDLQGNKIKIRAKDLFARVLQHEIDHTNGILIPERAYPDLKQLAGLRVVFMGSPLHATPYLTALAATEMNVVGVITETDKPFGRQQTITPTPVKQHAQALDIPVYTFEKIGSRSAIKTLKQLEPDLVIVVAYGQLLPKKVRDIAKYGFLNIHYSVLPKFRGATPHQTALLEGETKTGYTIFKIGKGLDSGPILVQKEIPIEAGETSLDLIIKMITPSINSLFDVLPGYIAGKRNLRKQKKHDATYTKPFKKEDGRIDWSNSVDTIDRQIRALSPWPAAFTEIDGQRLIIHEAVLEENKLRPTIVQPAGKQAMEFGAFLRGAPEKTLTFLMETGKIKLN